MRLEIFNQLWGVDRISFSGRSCDRDYVTVGQIGYIPEHGTTFFAGEPEIPGGALEL